MDGPKDQRVPGQPGAAAVCDLWEEEAHGGPNYFKNENYKYQNFENIRFNKTMMHKIILVLS
jgi:hypothetical protein